MNVDGTVVGTMNTPSNGPVSMPWTTTGVANGSHSVTISVLDSAGHGVRRCGWGTWRTRGEPGHTLAPNDEST